MMEKILTSPILYWTFMTLGGIGCLMFLTLVISMFVKEDGLIVINRTSTFYRIRFATMIPWSTLRGFFKEVNGAYEKHPTREWGQRMHCPYIRRVVIDAHFFASRETSLCGLFWTHLLSTTVLLPFIIVGLLISIPILIVGFIIFGIGFGFYFIGKTVVVHLGAFGKLIMEWQDQVNERRLQEQKLKLDDLLKGKGKKSFKSDLSNLKNRIRENGFDYAKQQQEFVEKFFQDIRDGIVPDRNPYSVQVIIQKVHDGSETAIQEIIMQSLTYSQSGTKIRKEHVEILRGLFIDTEFSRKALADLDNVRKKLEMKEIKAKIKEQKRRNRQKNWGMLKAVWNKTMCPTIKFVDNSVSLEKK